MTMKSESPWRIVMSRRPAISVVRRVSAVLAVIVLLAGCASAAAPAKSQGADPTKDKLAQHARRGRRVGPGGLNSPPQSIRVDGATRDPQTKCQPNEITAREVT